ncbi:MAG: hypothetical protein C0467_21915 [Planctomycetaceae bacterium]|nr:hypothetical protein [Planctomycetaceae bacterium]
MKNIPAVVVGVEVPSANWSIDQLKVYIGEAITKTALASWRLGKACLLAKKLVAHGNFKQWLKTEFPKLSYATVKLKAMLTELETLLQSLIPQKTAK